MLTFIADAIMSQAHAMLSQIDKDLVAQCDAIAAQGGPLKLNEMELESTNSNNQQVAQLIYVDEKLNGNQPENDSSRDLEAHVQLTMLNSNDVGGMYITNSSLLGPARYSLNKINVGDMNSSLLLVHLFYCENLSSDGDSSIFYF
jgi:hypothetical protein